MTQQEIQERNEQIALMLGMKIEGTYITNWKEFNSLLHSIEDTLKFHSDWNWLMEAIQFLQKHFESKDRYWTTIERYPLYSNIEDVFVVVSDFAKLYNNKEL
jgi:hypothetical protein